MTISVGDALPPFVIESVSADAMKNWAVFLADPNPIHLDVDVVKAMGLGDKVINQGPANVAYVANMLMAAIPGARIDRMDNRFVDNAYAGDRLVASGSVTAVDGNRISCETLLIANDSRTVITGTATLILT
jgi:3-hydroxybutyryl-CoA dehydratase